MFTALAWLTLMSASPAWAGAGAPDAECERRLLQFAYADSATVWLGYDFDEEQSTPSWVARVRRTAHNFFPLSYVVLTADLDAQPEGALARGPFDAPRAIETLAWTKIFAAPTNELIRNELMVRHHRSVNARIIRARQAYLMFLSTFEPQALEVADRQWIERNLGRLVNFGPDRAGRRSWTRIEGAAQRLATAVSDSRDLDDVEFYNLYRWLLVTFHQFPHLIESRAAAMRILKFDEVMSGIEPDQSGL